jgi:hypothetical protein
MTRIKVRTIKFILAGRFESYGKLNHSETDLGVSVVIMLVNLIGVYMLLYAYSQEYPNLNKFLEEFSQIKLPSISKEEEKKYKKENTYYYSAMVLILWGLSLCLSYLTSMQAWPLLQNQFGIDSSLLLVYYIVCWLSCCSLYASPICLATEMLMDALIQAPGFMCIKWHEKIKEMQQEGNNGFL